MPPEDRRDDQRDEQRDDQPGDRRPDKLSIVVFSGDVERVHYALALASAAAATNIPATLFFTMGGLKALLKDRDGTPGWHALSAGESGASPSNRETELSKRGAATFAELLDACVELHVTFMVCEMGLRATGLTVGDLRADIPYATGGIVTLLADVKKTGQLLFV